MTISVKGKVILLPSENIKYDSNNTNRIGKYANRDFLQFLKGFDKETEKYIRQYNTYILCDKNPIEQGDYVILHNKPHKVIKENNGSLSVFTEYASYYIDELCDMKIIATDNEDLGLPSINESFLMEYCRLDGLCSIAIDYESYGYEPSMGGNLYQPKVMDNNEIDVYISESKEIFNRDEVINLINTAFTLGMNTEYKNSYISNPDLKKMINRL